MTLYLAAKYSHRPTILYMANLLRLWGHVISGRWLTGSHYSTIPDDQACYAEEDLQDIDAADAVIIFQLPIDHPEASSGRHIEFGYALGRGKHVILVGQQTSVFHYHKHVTRYDSIASFLTAHHGSR